MPCASWATISHGSPKCISRTHTPSFAAIRRPPTQEEHRVASVYHNLGGGGVDFPAVFKVIRDRHYKGWAIFDVDGPRKGDDGFDAIGGDLDFPLGDFIGPHTKYLPRRVGGGLPP